MNQTPRLNPATELEVSRLFRAPIAAFWRCWTQPALLVKWWAPSPVLTTHAVIEAYPGGRFHTTTLMPDGTGETAEGCFLAVDPQSRIVFTDMLERGYRPRARPEPGFTATITFTAESGGTRYTVRLQHATPATRQMHDDMGFHEKWGLATSQLGALADSLAR